MPAPPRTSLSTPVVTRPRVPTIAAAYAPGSRGATTANPLAKVLGYTVAPAKATPAPGPAVGVRGPRVPTNYSVAQVQNVIAAQVKASIPRSVSGGRGTMVPGRYAYQGVYRDQYGRPQTVNTPYKIDFPGLDSGVTGGRGNYIPWNVQGVMGSLDTATGNFYVNGKLVDLGGGGGGGGDGGGGGGGGYGPSPDFAGVPSMNLMLWRI